MAILDYSKDASKSITLRFYTHEHGPAGQPLYYHTPEEPAVIRGYVEFSTIKEVKASDITLTFEARAESKWTEDHGGSHITFHHLERYQTQSWDVKLNRTNTSTPKSITPGVTRFEFEVQLDPGLPPTVEGRKGWFHYRFKAFMQRDFPYRNMAVKQLVWVYSSELRADQVEAEREMLGISKSVIWKDALPVTCSIPSTGFLYQGQVFPLTIQVDPFLENSSLKGMNLIVVSTVIKLKQYTIVRDPRMLNKARRDKKAVVVLPVMDEWPETNLGFKRVVMVTLPGARELGASIDTVAVTKMHVLKVIMTVRTPLMDESEAKEIRVEMDVRITSPRPEHIKGIAPEYSTLPPPYQANDSDEGDENDNEAMPPEFSHSGTSQSESQHLDFKNSGGV